MPQHKSKAVGIGKETTSEFGIKINSNYLRKNYYDDNSYLLPDSIEEHSEIYNIRKVSPFLDFAIDVSKFNEGLIYGFEFKSTYNFEFKEYMYYAEPYIGIYKFLSNLDNIFYMYFQYGVSKHVYDGNEYLRSSNLSAAIVPPFIFPMIVEDTIEVNQKAKNHLEHYGISFGISNKIGNLKYITYGLSFFSYEYYESAVGGSFGKRMPILEMAIGMPFFVKKNLLLKPFLGIIITPMMKSQKDLQLYSNISLVIYYWNGHLSRAKMNNQPETSTNTGKQITFATLTLWKRINESAHSIQTTDLA